MTNFQNGTRLSVNFVNEIKKPRRCTQCGTPNNKKWRIEQAAVPVEEDRVPLTQIPLTTTPHKKTSRKIRHPPRSNKNANRKNLPSTAATKIPFKYMLSPDSEQSHWTNFKHFPTVPSYTASPHRRARTIGRYRDVSKLNRIVLTQRAVDGDSVKFFRGGTQRTIVKHDKWIMITAWLFGTEFETCFSSRVV